MSNLYGDIHPLPDAGICISRLVLLNVAHRDVDVVDLHLFVSTFDHLDHLAVDDKLMMKRADNQVDKIPHRDSSHLRSLPEDGGFYYVILIKLTLYLHYIHHINSISTLGVH